MNYFSFLGGEGEDADEFESVLGDGELSEAAFFVSVGDAADEAPVLLPASVFFEFFA